jgi:hypothetical protein
MQKVERSTFGFTNIANPLWGGAADARRTAQTGDRCWANQLRQIYGVPSQGWRTFLRNQGDGIAAMDLFGVPTVSFRLCTHPTAEWVANQLTQACGCDGHPPI